MLFSCKFLWLLEVLLDAPLSRLMPVICGLSSVVRVCMICSKAERGPLPVAEEMLVAD